MDFRNTTVVGLAVAVGMGVTQANASLAQFPEWVTTIFGKSPVVLATIVAIVLNLTLPRTQRKLRNNSYMIKSYTNGEWKSLAVYARLLEFIKKIFIR